MGLRSSSLPLVGRYVCTNACEQTKPGEKKKERREQRGDTKNGRITMEEEEEEKRGKRNEEADRRKISRGIHGRSVLVAGGWRIGRVAMAKRAGVFSEFGGVRPNGKPPFGKFVASPRRTMPRCRRFSSAWLIDSATNQRPRRSSTHFLHFTLYLSPPHIHTRTRRNTYIYSHIHILSFSPLFFPHIYFVYYHHYYYRHSPPRAPALPSSRHPHTHFFIIDSTFVRTLLGSVSAINTTSTYVCALPHSPPSSYLTPTCVLFESRCTASGCNNASYRS